MQKVTYYCDGCGAEKKEVNHWYATRIDSEGFTVRPIEGCGSYSRIYCGQGCVTEALSKYMEACRAATEVRCPDSVPTDLDTLPK